MPLKLSPLQIDIVMMLEEAGAETVGPVIATLKRTDQSEFAMQVDGLVSPRFDTEGREQPCADRAGANCRPVPNWRNILISFIGGGVNQARDTAMLAI